MPIPRTLLDSPLADLDLELRAGAWPHGLDGEIFISTSERATAPIHGFFGDGVMIRLSLTPGSHGAPADRFAWRHRVIDTPTRRLREARPDVWQANGFGWSSPFGYANSANTAPLPWDGRLFATWDAGRPVEVDPVSLRFLGDVGQRDSWGDDVFGYPVLPMFPSTAHPVVDPERGCLWSMRSNPITGEVHVVRWDGQATTVRRWPLEGVALPQSMHTVAQTHDWLVLIDCAFRVDPAEAMGMGERSVTTFADEPAWLVRKDDLEAAPDGQPVAPRATLRLAPELNHYFATWDDTDGVRLLLEHTPDTDLAMALRTDDVDAGGRPVDPRLRGLYTHAMAAGRVDEVVLDPTSGAVVDRATFARPETFWATQLSAMDWSLDALAKPTVHTMLFTGYRPDAVTERALALYGERVDRGGLPDDEVPARMVTLERPGLRPLAEWGFAPDDYPTSPCFVPRPGGTAGGHDGWVLVPVLNDDGFRIDVLDAGDIAAGPVAVLAAPGGATVPFIIHSAWAPSASPAPAAERLRFADDLDDDRTATLPDDLADSVRRVARDLDDDLACA
jgi:all-trans-8'-apo-beta-carotenal 15,15'-oxygenase